MSFKRKLESYLDSWVEKSIISTDQKRLMLDDLGHQNTTERLFKIFAIIGSMFIGAGIILIISSNWEYLPKMIKLLLILFMPVVSLGGGVYLNQTKQEYKKIGDAFIILGTLLIGASIALLGQLYHLDGSIGSLLMWWFILSLPIMLFFKYRILGAISIVLFYSSIFYFVVDDRWWRVDEQLLVWTFTLLPLALIVVSKLFEKMFESYGYKGIIYILQIISIKVLFITLFIGTFDDGDFALLGDSIGSLMLQNALFIGAVFYVMWYANKNYYTVLRHTTFVWLAIFMIVKYFAWFWDYFSTGLFFVLFGIFLLALVVVYIKITKHINQIKKQAENEVQNQTNSNKQEEYEQ